MGDSGVGSQSDCGKFRQKVSIFEIDKGNTERVSFAHLPANSTPHQSPTSRFRWANEAVSNSVVQAVLNAWEMERHHAAERHLYPEVADVLAEIKAQHPDVIMGAVTDGKANPLFMTFTLAPYFDFCISWEDDQVGRQKFFSDLASVKGNAELKWIYDAALEKFQELWATKVALQKEPSAPRSHVWIHVGDDLAYDVGGSAQSGAKTIWLELNDERYQQTARQRFSDLDQPQPDWSTSTRSELEKRRIMNDIALEMVDAKVQFISRLPDAINDILEKENAAMVEQQSVVEKETK